MKKYYVRLNPKNPAHATWWVHDRENDLPLLTKTDGTPREHFGSRLTVRAMPNRASRFTIEEARAVAKQYWDGWDSEIVEADEEFCLAHGC